MHNEPTNLNASPLASFVDASFCDGHVPYKGLSEIVMTVVRILARTVCNVAVYGLLLFAPAGTLDWWRAWLLLVVLLMAMLGIRFGMLRGNDGVLQERRKPPFQAGQPRADKILVVAFLIIFPAFITVIPVDVFRVHILPTPSMLASAVGLTAAIAGMYLVGLSLRENAFAAAIVKHQVERQQRVIDSGVYSIVRHPFYVGVGLIVIGVAVWLQSYASALLSLVPVGLLIIRLQVEERFLVRRLPGYDAYIKRVRYRLIPRVW